LVVGGKINFVMKKILIKEKKLESSKKMVKEKKLRDSKEFDSSKKNSL
jgi:hypothetical protein